MIIGLLSDIHGNAPALSAALMHLEARTGTILVAGDFAGYYPFVNECIEMLSSYSIIGVRGNHDDILLQYLDSGKIPPDYQKKYGSALVRCTDSLTTASKKFLAGLPLRQDIILSGTSITMVHGTPWNPLDGRIYPDFSDWQRFDECTSDIIIIGHTHYPLERPRKNRLLVNPGSVGQPRDKKKGSCFAELDISQRSVQFYRIPYNSRRIIEDARIHDPENAYLIQVLQ